MTEIARWKEPIVYEVSAIYYTEDDPDWLTPRKAWTEHTLSIEAFGIPDMKPDYYAILYRVDGKIVQEQRFATFKDAKSAAKYRASRAH